MKTNKKIIILSLVILVAAIFFWFWTKGNTLVISGKQYHKISGYMHPEPDKNYCQALSPECGYCPGVVQDKKCYVED